MRRAIRPLDIPCLRPVMLPPTDEAPPHDASKRSSMVRATGAGAGNVRGAGDTAMVDGHEL
jgi:hypothetical protein